MSAAPGFRSVPGSPEPSGYAAATAYLLERKTQGVAFGLERMRRFAAALGQPQEQVPCIHIAGTNGKGSVAAMIEGILRGAGWRTGLYTSPHLVRLGERVQVDRRILSPEEIAAQVDELRRVVREIEEGAGRAAGPSYFEFMTGLALRHFARCGCDVAVLEAGLGGRLDATNIVTPEVSVITSVGLDHCEMLGDSLAAIAREKAGIVKPGRPVVIGRLPPEAETVVRSVAGRLGARVHSVREEFGEDGRRWPRPALFGEYQRWNAATATLAARVLDPRWGISDAVIERALAAVAWPGRWETIAAGDRQVIVDSSHNPEGAAVLDANLRALVERTGRAPVIVTGILGPDRAAAILPVACRHAREIHLVVPAQRRACSFEQLAALIPSTYGGAVRRSTVEAIFPAHETCLAGAAGDAVVVTGSIYLAGEVLGRLRPELGPSESGLQDF